MNDSYFIVLRPDGSVFASQLFKHRSVAIDRLCAHAAVGIGAWPQAEEQGWRCVEVQLIEVKK